VRRFAFFEKSTRYISVSVAHFSMRVRDLDDSAVIAMAPVPEKKYGVAALFGGGELM
jgi:hypothetical protein